MKMADARRTARQRDRSGGCAGDGRQPTAVVDNGRARSLRASAALSQQQGRTRGKGAVGGIYQSLRVGCAALPRNHHLWRVAAEIGSHGQL